MSKIVLEDFNGGNGYYKINLAYLSKEQVEEIEALVSKWGPTDEDIKSCIGMCLTDANEQRFKDYGTNLKDCLAWLEKQGEKPQKTLSEMLNDYFENTPKKQLDKNWEELKHLNNIGLIIETVNEPKFKVGDWIISKYMHLVMQILNNDNGFYKTVEIDGTERNDSYSYIDRNFKFWTLQEDAKDGDVLFQDLMRGKTFIYNGVNSDMAILYSFIISNDGKDVLPYHIGKPNTGIGNIEENKNIIHPATKEQRDLLFRKMRESGYEWDSEKKSLGRLKSKVSIKWRNNNGINKNFVIMNKPKSKHGERFVEVKATIKTWTEVEDIITFDTETNQFIIPNNYQVDAKVISWNYIE